MKLYTVYVTYRGRNYDASFNDYDDAMRYAKTGWPVGKRWWAILNRGNFVFLRQPVTDLPAELAAMRADYERRKREGEA